MKHYLLVSPTMSDMIPITDDGRGPVEEWCDVACVLAENKKEARKSWRKLEKWRDRSQDEYGWPPHWGIKAEEVICPHGVTGNCGMEDCPIEGADEEFFCKQCEAEWKEQDRDETIPAQALD